MGALAEESLAYQLQRLSMTLHARTSAVLEPLNVPFPQYVCLRLLHSAPHQSNAQLARAVGVSMQAMNAALLRMQRAGLIDRPLRVDQGRARPATLTVRGRTVFEHADAAVREVEALMLSGLTDQQCAVFRAVLSALWRRTTAAPPAAGAGGMDLATGSSVGRDGQFADR